MASPETNAPVPFTYHVDRARRLVRVTGHGFWTQQQVCDHFAHLAKLLDSVRDKDGLVSALIDLRDAPVQSREVSLTIKREAERIYNPNDRLATVQTSALLLLQMRQIVPSSRTASFATMAEAEAWLAAD